MISSTDEVSWLESRVQNDVAILKILVPRLEAKVHKKSDYVRYVTDSIAEGHNRLVLDLSQLSYSNHTWGLFQVIFAAFHPINAAGGQLALAGLKGHPKRVFLFAELDRYLPAYHTADEAVKELSK